MAQQPYRYRHVTWSSHGNTQVWNLHTCKIRQLVHGFNFHICYDMIWECFESIFIDLMMKKNPGFMFITISSLKAPQAQVAKLHGKWNVSQVSQTWCYLLWVIMKHTLSHRSSMAVSQAESLQASFFTSSSCRWLHTEILQNQHHYGYKVDYLNKQQENSLYLK